MAKKSDKVVPPAVPTAVVVPVTTPPANAVATVPPSLDPTVSEFIASNAEMLAGGKLGQAKLGREIGRWAFDGKLTDAKENSQLGLVVALSVRSTAIAMGKPEPTAAELDPKGKTMKGIVSKMRQCFKVGALPHIGRGAIDACYEFAISQAGERIFPTMVSAARVQRDHVTEGILSTDRFAELLAKETEEKSDDDKRADNLRAIRTAINAALGEGVKDAADMPPMLADSAQRALKDFRNGPLADMLVAVGAAATADDDKLVKELARKREALAKLEGDFASRMGKLN